MERKKSKIVYCFDIDNTLCKTDGTDYECAAPIYSRIAKVNTLYKDNTIILFTGRGFGTGKDWSEVTKKQVKTWGVKHHKLLFGKPGADRFIDDRGENADVFFGK